MDREALRSQAAARRNLAEVEQAPARKVKWTCEFCKHDYASERTFMNHRCHEREKMEELRSAIGQAAYGYYSEWMRCNKRSVPPIETFAESSYYGTFIRFANHVRRVSMPSPTGFIRVMTEQKILPTLWCRDNVYAMYMQGYDKAVPPTTQFLASVDFMAELAVDYNVPMDKVFDEVGVEKLLTFVQKRKLSPWFLVSSKVFRAFMKRCDPIDIDRLESGVQVGAMIMRIQQNKEMTKLFTEFATATNELGL